MGISWIPTSFYGRLTLAIVFLEAIVVMALQAYCASLFLPYFDRLTLQLKGTPVYLMIFLFSQLFQLYLIWDALIQQNTIQIIGFILFNWCTFAYAVFENVQLAEAKSNRSKFNLPINWDAMTPCVIASAVVIGLCGIFYTWVGFKLYREFGWKIYKKIGADPKMKSMYIIHKL